MEQRRESPMRRVMPNGDVRWLARYTDPADGKRKYWKPAWNGGRSTFALKRDAQRAIDEAYEHIATRGGVGNLDTLGAYAGIWLDRHPRSKRTNKAYASRLRALLDVKVEHRALREWRWCELRPRHAFDLVGVLLVDGGYAPSGVNQMIGTLSTMAKDAVRDEARGAEFNAFAGVKVRSDDERARKRSRKPLVLTFEEMTLFAQFGKTRAQRTMLRVFPDTGMRLGEVLGLEQSDFDGKHIRVKQTAHEGELTPGTKNNRGEDCDERVVPCPPTLATMIAKLPPRIDTPLLFPNGAGNPFDHANFYRGVWHPARAAVVTYAREKRPDAVRLAFLEAMNPHDCRHSYVSTLRAGGIDDADLAEITGHTVQTMVSTYTHALRRSDDAVREAIG